MRRTATAALAGSLLLLASTTAQADSNWSVAASAGTIGLGGNVSWRFHDHFALTGGYSGFSYDDLDQTVNDVNYEGDIDANVYSLKLDVYPWASSGFFVSAGAVRPDVQLDATGRAAGDFYEYQGVQVPADVGYLEGEAELSDGLEPYLGLGWRNSARAGLGFYAELGAFLIDPQASLAARGGFTSIPGAREAVSGYVEEQEREVQDELDKYGVYPVAVLGIEYTF